MRDRILVINPNSTAAVTRAIDDAMAPLRIPGGPKIACLTLDDGPPGRQVRRYRRCLELRRRSDRPDVGDAWHCVSIDAADDDIGRLGLVQFQTRPAVVAPAGQIHDHAGLFGLDRLHDVEPVAVEKESVLAEQVVELRNHWMVVGKWPGLRIGPKFARAVQS